MKQSHHFRRYKNGLIKLINPPMPKKRKRSFGSPLYYHGTDKLKAYFIKKEGLKPIDKLNSYARPTSDKTDPSYVYLFDSKDPAEIYAKAASERSGIPYEVVVADIDPEKFELESDFAIPIKGAKKYKGIIPADKILRRTSEGEQ